MAGHNRQPLYFNVSDRTVLAYIAAEGIYSEFPISAEVATISFENATPVRSVSSWKGKNTYEGDYWSATIRRHVHHESFLERAYLMTADFNRQIIGLQ